jgi:hypothetical protein
MGHEKTRKLALDRTVTSFTLGDCERCGHSPDDHRLDDSTNVAPTDPAAKFRCVGHVEGARWIDTDCDCPDYVENPQDVRRVAR